MLQQMRDWFRYLKWLLVIIIFMFIWWAFATWGGGTSRTRPEADWAARVNGVAIPVSTLQAYARRLDSTYQSLLGEQYAQQRSLIRIGQQAINTLVEQELIHQEALRQGITVTAREVVDSITRDPNFQENGQFIGRERYHNLFRNNRITVTEYEDQIRRGLVIDKFRRMIEDGVTVSEAEVEQEFRKRNVKATVEYLVVDPTRAKVQSPPAEADLQRHYEGHLDRFMQGEGRTGMFVLFGAAELSAAQSVTDEDVAAAYERLKATRFSTGEQRCAAHILIKADNAAAPDAVSKAEKRAREALKRARSGEDFAALARRYSEDSTAPAGGDLGCFGRGQMVREFEDAAFALQAGGISDLVRTHFGFHVIKGSGSRPPRTTPIEEVRETLRQEIQLDRARSEVQKRSTEFARAAAGGNLEAVAKSQGLTVQPIGEVREGDALPGLLASQTVVGRMLDMAPGQVSEPIAVPSGQVVVQVTGTLPASPRPLQEARTQILKDFEQERARESVARTVRSAGSPGGLKAAARALKTELKTQADVTRGAGLPGVPPDAEIEKQIDTLPAGTVGDPVSTSAGIVVLSVLERRDHKDEFAAERDSISDGLLRQRQDRLYRALVKRLREHADVLLNEAAIKAMDQA
ncbi:MAG: peptidyl-prolyl cis-trans isomerase [Acidobacteria bacterium]|nr:peptidyl-prolyl cis-trans isomerase [Acidobacteriota bacterium]